MTINSKILFQQLLSDFIVDHSREEKESILLWVLEHELGLNRAAVMSGKELIIHEPSLRQIIDRLNTHEPVQYITGEAEFYGRKFTVGPGVLIPRTETELLIETVLHHVKDHEQIITLLDIGTGSGCIAITLALELPQASLMATDISKEALWVAASNAQLHKANIQFLTHDILADELSWNLLDIVVSNPPYVRTSEKASMRRNVIDFEPFTALFVPDSDPLLFHRAIAAKAKSSLKPGGLLMTEINEALGRETAALFESLGYLEVTTIKDLHGKDRVVLGVKP